MKYMEMALVVYCVLGADGNVALAADGPSALGAMGFGGTLLGSNDRRRVRGTTQASPTRITTTAFAQDRRNLYLDDRRRRAEQHFELRRMNDSYRAQRRRPSLTPEQLANINESRLPQRLTREQWQPSDGVILWPSPLRGEVYAADRARLEQLFAERTSEDCGIGGTGYGEVRQRTRQMRHQLNRSVKQLSVEEYSLARKFLASLAYEARFEQVAAK
ncbi:MAG TPA: hypothetical protein VND64_06475 [Pirellulales bacterium]|nr:hypothetical protein [Pirellulales bacterium]